MSAGRRKKEPEFSQGSDVYPFQEYSTVFDAWVLRCTRAVLGGLITAQERGGLRVASFELQTTEDRLLAVVEHYGNQEMPSVRIGYRITLSRLRSMARDDDPDAAGMLYLDDMIQAWVPPGIEPVDGIYWVDRP
ncbi:MULTISPECIES: hypothetical protein [Actinomycetes]|uniref:hypothetical protein n=1 Tax=Actinomycetes TaxID=1760 RepID=UPI0036485891